MRHVTDLRQDDPIAARASRSASSTAIERRVHQIPLTDEAKQGTRIAPSPITRIVTNRREPLAFKRLGLLRPRVSLGELDHPLDLTRKAIERRCDQPGEDGRVNAPASRPPHRDPRVDDGLTPGICPGVRRGEDQALHHPG